MLISDEVVALDEQCAAMNVHFIAACARGLFGFVFCDFLENFTVLDTNGEPPLSGLYDHLSQLENAEVIVTSHEDSRHQLEAGDSVKLVPSKSNTTFGPFFVKKIIDAFSFTIDIGSNRMPEGVLSGEFVQTKVPKRIDFVRIYLCLFCIEKSQCHLFGGRPCSIHLLGLCQG